METEIIYVNVGWKHLNHVMRRLDPECVQYVKHKTKITEKMRKLRHDNA